MSNAGFQEYDRCKTCNGLTIKYSNIMLPGLSINTYPKRGHAALYYLYQRIKLDSIENIDSLIAKAQEIHATRG